MDSTPQQVVVAGIQESRLVDGKAVVKATADLGGKPSELEIAISTDLAPTVAIALLATTATQRAERDDLAPSLRAVAVGVVETNDPATVRLHFLFEQGAVLPIEMPKTAADALVKALSLPPESGFASL